MVSPLMYEASSETRKATTLAMSSTRPKRLKGMFLANRSFISSMDIPTLSAASLVISVSIQPGATALTLMLNRPSSSASVRAIACRPAFAAE
jgi:hypothetical protein